MRVCVAQPSLAPRLRRSNRAFPLFVKLVVNPESVNELYDLETDPDELLNRYGQPKLSAVQNDLTGRLYRRLRDRGDNFRHWMMSMLDVGGLDHDPSMSGLDEATYHPEEDTHV